MRRFSFRPGLHLKGRAFHGLRGFAGKPFHPPLTDLPIGAYTIGPVFDIISFIFRHQAWAPGLFKAGGYTLLAGAVASAFTVLTGFFDWLDTDKGTQIRRMANAHAWTMIAMTLFVLIDIWLHWFSSLSVGNAPVSMIGAVVIALATLGGTIGGSMVYDYGFNVETATDNPVYHASETDIISPKDPAS